MHNQSSIYECLDTASTHAQALKSKLHIQTPNQSQPHCHTQATKQTVQPFNSWYGTMYCRRLGQHPPNLQKLYPAHAKRLRKAPQRYTGVRTPAALQRSHSEEHSRPAQPHPHSGTSQCVFTQLVSTLSHNRFLGETGVVCFKGGLQGQCEQHGATNRVCLVYKAMLKY